MLSSINSIKNNTCQRQQSFGATADSTLKDNLNNLLESTSTPQELVDFFNADHELAMQEPPKDFATRFRALKAIGKNGEEVEPIVSSTNFNRSRELSTIDVGVMLSGNNAVTPIGTIHKTKTTPPQLFLDYFLTVIREAVNALQKPEDVKIAAEKGLRAFTSYL